MKPSFWLLLAVAGCASGDELSGSLSDVYRLEHDAVRARLYSSELSIEYFRSDGSVPVRVTLRRDDKEPKANSSFDLKKHGHVGGQLRDGTEVPRLLSGKLRLDEFEAEEGGAVVGSFEATFEGDRDTLGLSGSFDTALAVIDWPVEPEAE